MKKTLSFCFVLVLSACGVPKSKYTTLEDQMKGCQTQLASSKERLGKYEKDLASAEETQKSYEQRMAELASSKAELEQKTKTYEDLVGSLKEEINSGQIKISEMQGRLTVNLIDKILFDSGSTNLKLEGQAALKKISDVLNKVEGRRIQVEGHTDNVALGPELRKKFPSNWELSTARATSVVRFMAQSGVDEKKLSATGFSYFRPIGSNDTTEGKHMNRRIEVVLVPELAVAELPATPPSAAPTP